MKASHLVAFASGLLFAIGLGVSGMTLPYKVMGFLDVAGAWDPSLALVMVGAIGVHAILRRFAKPTPVFAPAYALPAATRLDARLLVGAALFGLGWGIAGFCPGPALVAVTSRAPSALAFVAAMIAGMGVHALLYGRYEARRGS